MTARRGSTSTGSTLDTDQCVAGEFTRDYNRDRSTSYTSHVVVRFTARGIDFDGHWVVFYAPVFHQTWHFDGVPTSTRDPIKAYAGTHRIPLSRVREITYDHGDCVP